MPPDEQPAAAEVPQDAQGEGAEGQSESYDSLPYDLTEVSPEVREQLEPHLKAIMGNVTKRFQEQSEYRQQWEPYEQLGINEIDPEGLQGLLEFADMSQNPEQFAQWWESVGDELGLFDQGEDDEDDESGFEDMSTEQIQQLVAQGVAEKVEPLYEQMAQQEQSQAIAEAEANVDAQLQQLQSEHDLEPEDIHTILQFAYSYEDDPESIARGFEDYQRTIGKGEKGMFAKKASQPAPAEGPGSADTSAEPITSMQEAHALALGRMREANQSG